MSVNFFDIDPLRIEISEVIELCLFMSVQCSEAINLSFEISKRIRKCV